MGIIVRLKVHCRPCFCLFIPARCRLHFWSRTW
jgi:hypothetical protein